MRALCWNGVNDLKVETVPDAPIANPHDAILRVTISTTCGSDLHFIEGYIPSIRAGDVIGHEFMGEVMENWTRSQEGERGDRAVVPSFICCGECWFCRHDLWSSCDNTNPNAEMQASLLGYRLRGYMATRTRSEAMRAHMLNMCGCRTPMSIACRFRNDCAMSRWCFFRMPPRRGTWVQSSRTFTRAIRWPCGVAAGVGLMAQKSAYLMGAERMIAIDRYPERLKVAREKAGAETINYEEVESVLETLQDMTGGVIRIRVLKPWA